MKITSNVILDLLPLYYAGEASEDTRKLIEIYLKENPEFATEFDEEKLKILPEKLPGEPTPEDEMITLKKTQRLLKIRSILFPIAIFLSALPFSFGDVSWRPEDGIHRLWKYNPEMAFIIGGAAALLWVAYYMVSRRLSVSGL